jgi:hypothetical protein
LRRCDRGADDAGKRTSLRARTAVFSAVALLAGAVLAAALAFPVSTTVSGLLALVSQDRSRLRPSDVVGTYQCVYQWHHLGRETFVVSSDGTFRQTFEYVDGRKLRSHGRWKLNCPDWATRAITLDHAWDPVAYDQRSLNIPPPRGCATADVHRRSGRADCLDPGEDAEARFERVPARWHVRCCAAASIGSAHLRARRSGSGQSTGPGSDISRARTPERSVQ